MRYSFTLAEDALLLFDSLTNNGSLNWTLTGPSGVIDGRNFNNSDAYQRDDATPFFAAAGAYVLTVAGNGQATGDFAFKLSDIAADRKSVVEGKRVLVRVDLGVGRIIKKNNKNNKHD